MQAKQVADLVAEVAQRNDEVRREAERLLDRLDEVVTGVLGTDLEDGERLARLEKSLESRAPGRVLVVDAAGHVLLDEGKVELGSAEQGSVLAQAQRIARGGAPDERAAAGGPFEVQPKRVVFRRVAYRYCLVLVRSEATMRALRLETGLNQILLQFKNDPAISYLRVEDREGELAAGFGVSRVDGVEEKRPLELSSGRYTLRVGVNTGAAREVERRAGQVPLLVGISLLVLGAAALALVFRQQSSYVEREKRLVARGEQDRRLASLGRLTAGVAHEIKNPLNTIQLSVGRLRRRVEDVDPRILAAITRSVATIAQTVEDFMNLARDPGLALETGDPAAVLQEAVSQVRPMAATAGRRIEVVAAATHVKVRLDAARLREAFVNLLRNAVQASKGKVEVRLRREEGECLVHIDDDGPGIPPEKRDEIFEFFYTTKEAGTGLGLPLAHRVAEEHDGTLEVSEAPMGGARFTLRLRCR